MCTERAPISLNKPNIPLFEYFRPQKHRGFGILLRMTLEDPFGYHYTKDLSVVWSTWQEKGAQKTGSQNNEKRNNHQPRSNPLVLSPTPPFLFLRHSRVRYNCNSPLCLYEYLEP